mgnify:CR=1 FL=1
MYENKIITEPKWKSWIVETTTPLFTPDQCRQIIEAGRRQPPHILRMPEVRTYKKTSYGYNRGDMGGRHTNKERMGYDRLPNPEKCRRMATMVGMARPGATKNTRTRRERHKETTQTNCSSIGGGRIYSNHKETVEQPTI